MTTPLGGGFLIFIKNADNHADVHVQSVFSKFYLYDWDEDNDEPVWDGADEFIEMICKELTANYNYICERTYVENINAC